MIKFNLLPISLAAVLVTISLGSTHSFSPNVQVLQKRFLQDETDLDNSVLDDVPLRNYDDDDDVTQQPPVKPSKGPSIGPTAVPTRPPSPFPTLMPTNEPTVPVPTVPSVPVPTAGTDVPDGGTDTLDPCSSNGDGSFGNISTEAIEIKYDYEMVTVASANIEDTLSKLEDAISAAILGSSFLTCGINRNLAAGLRQKKETITGISSKANEKITEDGECTHE